tara:strand:+ start:722 stop:1843 length:1122 start_codon:yes stop_codon:yes gene_type:complete
VDFIDLSAQQKRVRKNIEKRLINILDHGKYIMGPEVSELEEDLSSYVGVKHCLTCSSGTDALLIPLMAKGIGPGDAVITSPFTFIATAEVITLLGATPIFCDIYPETFNLNPGGLKEAYDIAVSKGLKPKAIISVDLFGLPARYRLINKFAIEKDMFLIEDAAQGFGGSIKGVKAGNFGEISSTSFFPAKPLGCYGDAGAIFTNDDYIYNKMKSIRVHGTGQDKYDNIRIGLNARIDTIQAAIIIEKLKIFDDELIKRNNIAKYYSENINSNFIKPYVPKKYFSSWAQYSIVLSNKKLRDEIIIQLKEVGIPSMIYYRIPLHLQKVFKFLKNKRGDFPFSENISDSILSLPMHPYLKEEDQNKIIEKLNSITF